ncbi:hypothetical protein GCM10009092_18710 [Bowmanella denitrificans]|uniref:N-acetyltransferase domain-containing protein n=1 Tax=Bowmanella denitrificans TaxID=366582 RepID=A0ABN0X448_9ALTE|nr:GNAT family N-acetyltransferase [Bowmanella denitrificans]
MSFVLRAAKVEEAQSLSVLALRSKAYWAYSADFMAAVADELTLSCQQLLSEQWACQVAEGKDIVLGYALIDKTHAGQWQLDALFVEPQAIGQGVGRALMDWVKQHMAEHNITSLIIQSDPHAEMFYLAMGAKRIGELPSASIAGRMLPLLELAV